MGVPRSVVDCLFTTLQNAFHHVRTGFGDSRGSYGGPVWLLPIHGIGQGNGAGPAIWAVVSTPLLNILRELGFGFEYATPISCIPIRFSGFAFVDNTDLIQMLHAQSSSDEVKSKLQEAVDRWEGVLSATGGAIVPEKTYWYLIDFCSHSGVRRYCSNSDRAGSLSVNDISGEHKVIRRVEVDTAEETLGIFLAPSGSMDGEIEKLKRKVADWIQQLSSSKLTRPEMWTAAQTTIWRTLAYPLPAINLSRQQWEKILSPLLKFVLPNIGICRSFPQFLVFAPVENFGLGFLHLFTLQEITRIKDLIFHTVNHTTTGKLGLSSLEILHIELGSFAPLDNLPFTTWSSLITPSLIKSTWEFLDCYGFSLRTSITCEWPREGDCYLMPAFLTMVTDSYQLQLLNLCRLFLRALFLSDIVDGSGKFILEEAWRGSRPIRPDRLESWPNQQRPPAQAWDLWRQTIKKVFLCRGFWLRTPFGPWRQLDQAWPWYFCTHSRSLYHLSHKQWQRFDIVQDRPVRPTFCPQGIASEAPCSPHHATVYHSSSSLICSGFGQIQPNPTSPETFDDYLSNLDKDRQWCVEFLRLTKGTWEDVISSLQAGTLYVISVGSFVASYLTGAFIMEDHSNTCQVQNCVIAPGRATDMSAYRGELSGIYASVFLIYSLCKFFQITDGSVELGCDGQSALTQAFMQYTPHSVDCPSYDLIMAIHHLRHETGISWTHQYVAGHQDDHKEWSQLSCVAQLNVQADILAK
jgi:hypothetical protein